jgi:hypothetical protein
MQAKIANDIDHERPKPIILTKEQRCKAFIKCTIAKFNHNIGIKNTNLGLLYAELQNNKQRYPDYSLYRQNDSGGVFSNTRTQRRRKAQIMVWR